MRLPRTSAYRPRRRVRAARAAGYSSAGEVRPYGRTGERTRDAQPSTKPCQHETHVHTLAPHTHCVDTAGHLMANSSCTVKLNCYSMASSS